MARRPVVVIPGQLALEFDAPVEPFDAPSDEGGPGRCRCCGVAAFPGADLCRFCRIEACQGACGLARSADPMLDAKVVASNG